MLEITSSLYSPSFSLKKKEYYTILDSFSPAPVPVPTKKMTATTRVLAAATVVHRPLSPTLPLFFPNLMGLEGARRWGWREGGKGSGGGGGG